MDDIYVDAGKGVDHLYVIRPIERAAFTKKEPLASSVNDQLFVRNRTLWALGVALLELTYGAPLSACRTDEDGNDAYSQYSTALRLTKKVQEDELSKFALAVFNCMHPAAESCDFALKNEGCRRHFWQKVVLPLKEDYEELPVLKAQPFE
jgi:hypothetical protein